MSFDAASSGRPCEIFPTVYDDARGSFAEVLVKGDVSGIMQINRSTSKQKVLRGCHAQTGQWCQSKIVEALNHPIYDIITDMRPDSSSFRLTAVYNLDPKKQNKLFVPKGFLHAFVVPPYEGEDDAIFMYYCDNVYHKDAEICVNPMSLLPKIVDILPDEYCKQYDLPYLKQLFRDNDLVLSEKDTAGMDYSEWAQKIAIEYEADKILWYTDIKCAK